MPDAIDLIDETEFSQLVGHLRMPTIGFMYDELSWVAARSRLVLGLVLRDRYDQDFSWVLFVHGADGYETVDVGHSLPSAAAALAGIRERMAREL
jgi:hypothetical protein